MKEDGSQSPYNDVISFLEESPVYFKNPQVFDESYVPPRIMGRDSEIAELTNGLKYVIQGFSHPNMAIFGRPGTGKSLVVRYVLKGLKFYISNKGLDVPYVYSYVPCKDYTTEIRALEKIIFDLTGEEVRLTGRSRTYGYNLIKSAIEGLGGPITVVLDDVDMLSNPDRVLMSLSRLETERGSLSLILISNSIEFERSLESRTSSGLKSRKIVFASYTAPQLEEILWDRVREGVVDGLISPEDGVVQYCAAVAAQVGGDARYAIALLRETVALAEREGIRKITVEVAKRGHEKYEESVVAESVRKLPLHSQLILLATAIPLVYKALPRGRNYLTSGEVFEIYSELSRLVGTTPVTYRRYFDLLQELETLGLVKTKTKSLGRKKGRTQAIFCYDSPGLIVDTIIQSTELLTRDEVDEYAKKLVRTERLFT